MQIIMIRHGQAAAGWDTDIDPGLSVDGHRQAASLVPAIKGLIDQGVLDGPVPIISSPLLRCQETARPLAEAWQQTVQIDPRVRELPSPSTDVTERGIWLRQAMAGTWSALDAAEDSQNVDFKAWRQGIMAAITQDCDYPALIIVSHFIAINVVYGRAVGQDDIVCFRPDNTSITVFSVEAPDRIKCVL